jgi:hypothetical protein
VAARYPRFGRVVVRDVGNPGISRFASDSNRSADAQKLPAWGRFAPFAARSGNDRSLRQAAVADRGAERSHSAGAGTGFGLRPALAVADEPRRNGRLLPVKRAVLHCGGQRFESPPLHQVVLINGGCFQVPEISRGYKALAWSSAVCDGHFAGLSASRGGKRRRVSGRKISFPKSALVGPAKATNVGDPTVAPISNETRGVVGDGLS